MNCDFCGAVTPPGAPYCNFCGKPIVQNPAGQERPPGANGFPGPIPQTPPSQYTAAYPFSSAPPATGPHQPVAVPHQVPYIAPQYPVQQAWQPLQQAQHVQQSQPWSPPSSPVQPPTQFLQETLVQPPTQFLQESPQPLQAPARQAPTAFSGRTLIRSPFITEDLPPVNPVQPEFYGGTQNLLHYRSPGTQNLPPVSPDQMHPAGGYHPPAQFFPPTQHMQPPTFPQGSPDTDSLSPTFGYNNQFGAPDVVGTYAPASLPNDDDDDSEDSSDDRYKKWLRPKRRKKSLIIGASTLLAVVLIGIVTAILLLPLQNSPGSSSTNTGSSTPGQGINQAATTTPGQQSSPVATITMSKGIPSSSTVNAGAAAIISEIKTTNKIDEKTLQPTKTTNTFKPKEVVYITFKLDSKGKDGYILSQWYGNGHEVGSKIHKHKAANDRGLFGLDYHDPATGAVALYWCTKEKCEDKQLAAVTTFTVVGDKTGNGTPTQNTLVAEANFVGRRLIKPTS